MSGETKGASCSCYVIWRDYRYEAVRDRRCIWHGNPPKKPHTVSVCTQSPKWPMAK